MKRKRPPRHRRKKKRNTKRKQKGGTLDFPSHYDYLNDPDIQLMRNKNFPPKNVPIIKKPFINFNQFPKMPWNRKVKKLGYDPPPGVFQKAKGVIGKIPMKSKGLVGKFPMGKTGMKAAAALAGVAALSGVIAGAIDKAK